MSSAAILRLPAMRMLAACDNQPLTWPDAIAIAVPTTAAIVAVVFMLYFVFKARQRS